MREAARASPPSQATLEEPTAAAAVSEPSQQQPEQPQGHTEEPEQEQGHPGQQEQQGMREVAPAAAPATGQAEGGSREGGDSEPVGTQGGPAEAAASRKRGREVEEEGGKEGEEGVDGREVAGLEEKVGKGEEWATESEGIPAGPPAVADGQGRAGGGEGSQEEGEAVGAGAGAEPEPAAEAGLQGEPNNGGVEVMVQQVGDLPPGVGREGVFSDSMDVEPGQEAPAPQASG
jgi:hypothetical protein